MKKLPPIENALVDVALATEVPHTTDNGFTDDEQSIGRQLQELAPTTIARILLVGQKLAEAHASLSRRGRGSKYPDFCEEFLPTIDQKTLDRWRQTYEGFCNVVSITPEIGTDCPYLSNLRLTAMYRLTRPGVTDDLRNAALTLAKTGLVVTEKLAASLVNGNDMPQKQATTIHRKKVPLPSGTVRISINHPDFKEALMEAISLLEGN
jgi:hypothetical protein